jgi:osmotically inducible protein OsmC
LPGFEDSEGTNPEPLAAAPAACFSMALSDAGHPLSSIHMAARVHLRVVSGAPAIQQLDLNTRADVPGLGPEEFQECAEQAKASCITSHALGGVAQINLPATLAS